MSTESCRYQAGRWLRQARADLRAAEASRAAGSFEWACFQSQQAAEKALKAIWYHHGFDPWGHSAQKLIQDFPDQGVGAELSRLTTQARHLDRLYVPTRYPNGLPDLTPAEVYTDRDAREAIEAAEAVIRHVGSEIGS